MFWIALAIIVVGYLLIKVQEKHNARLEDLKEQELKLNPEYTRKKQYQLEKIEYLEELRDISDEVKELQAKLYDKDMNKKQEVESKIMKLQGKIKSTKDAWFKKYPLSKYENDSPWEL
jgi:uncharacterized protein HemX